MSGAKSENPLKLAVHLFFTFLEESYNVVLRASEILTLKKLYICDINHIVYHFVGGVLHV